MIFLSVLLQGGGGGQRWREGERKIVYSHFSSIFLSFLFLSAAIGGEKTEIEGGREEENVVNVAD